VDVAAALVFRGGKLLITQRHADAHLGGLWEFPGGKREGNETFEQCLARELREELGIEVAVGELVESLTHKYPRRTVHLRFFRCAWLRHEPQRLGCVDLAWIGVEQLGQYAFPDADMRLLAKLRASPEWWRAGGGGM
jgi:mutator protein MutT